MRLDKFLKVARVIKRRTVAKKVADSEKISVNGAAKKPSYEVKEGDIVELTYYDSKIKFKIVSIPSGNVGKDSAKELVEIIEESGN